MREGRHFSCVLFTVIFSYNSPCAWDLKDVKYLFIKLNNEGENMHSEVKIL